MACISACPCLASCISGLQQCCGNCCGRSQGQGWQITCQNILNYLRCCEDCTCCARSEIHVNGNYTNSQSGGNTLVNDPPQAVTKVDEAAKKVLTSDH